MIRRVIWIILDSVGMGELPDANKFGDVGSNTIGNISKMVGGLNLPNMRELGLGNIDEIKGVGNVNNPKGCYGKFAEVSNGKDTTIGHWEMTGIYSKNPLPTYPNGFPKEIVEQFEKETGKKIIGNIPSSGTEIIEKLGEEHLKTGKLIVYTSADSVFQIAAHEEIVPIDDLYKYCRIARKILKDEHAVARVIARPFLGELGDFKRTANRRDFSIKPPTKTVLDYVCEKGKDVIAVGKIEDIFAEQGITKAVHTKSNEDGVRKTIEFIKEKSEGLIYTNLVDFDAKWGHRNDYKAYAKGLEEFDLLLPEIINSMNDDDVLFINADHGCDPTMPGTDHSREYIPFLAFGKELNEDVNLKTRSTFSDIGQTIAEIFDIKSLDNGSSFLSEIKK